MTKKSTKDTLIKKLIKQISGQLTEEDELIPEVAIDGSGEIWCWDPINKMHRKIYRGVKAFILYENYEVHYLVQVYRFMIKDFCILIIIICI